MTEKGHELSFRYNFAFLFKDFNVPQIYKRCIRFEKYRGKENSGVGGREGEHGARAAMMHAGDKCVHATKRRHIDRTHVRSDENLHATSCGLSLSLSFTIKSSVTILSRYPRGVEAAPIIVATTMMMMMVVVTDGGRA